MRTWYIPIWAVALLVLGACSEFRAYTDVGVATAGALADKVLVEAKVEHDRVHALKCHSPLRTPAAVARAAGNPALGQDWIDDMMEDCPEYRAFVSDLVMRRAVEAGLRLPEPEVGEN